jgi:hypothetical protein
MKGKSKKAKGKNLGASAIGLLFFALCLLPFALPCDLAFPL